MKLYIGSIGTLQNGGFWLVEVPLICPYYSDVSSYGVLGLPRREVEARPPPASDVEHLGQRGQEAKGGL